MSRERADNKANYINNKGCETSIWIGSENRVRMTETTLGPERAAGHDQLGPWWTHTYTHSLTHTDKTLVPLDLTIGLVQMARIRTIHHAPQNLHATGHICPLSLSLALALSNSN